MTQIQQVISIAIAQLREHSPTAHQCRLIKVEQHIARGQYLWTASFKPTRSLPEDPAREPVGAGGEVFVHVDLRNLSSTITYGE
jgi:hypothetical protein